MSADMNNNQAGQPSELQASLRGGLSSYAMTNAEAARVKKLAQIGVVSTYAFWGIMPLYWALLPAMPAGEIVLHRLVWTTICSFLVVLYRKQFGAAIALLTDRKNMLIVLGCAALMLGNNLVYIWAVTNNQVVEASLGYFLTPILQMGFGIIFFKDRTTFLQKAAIALACLGVAIQVAMLGKLPLVALGVALTFAGYTALKKAASYGTGPGLFWETGVIAPVAGLAIIWLEFTGQGTCLASPWWVSLLLIGTGPITTFPLLWFSFGARQLSLIIVGLLQYITPSFTLLLGIFWFKEPVDSGQYVSFAFIFAALVTYTYEMLRHMHMAERLARRHRLHKLEKLRKQRPRLHHPRKHKE